MESVHRREGEPLTEGTQLFKVCDRVDHRTDQSTPPGADKKLAFTDGKGSIIALHSNVISPL